MPRTIIRLSPQSHRPDRDFSNSEVCNKEVPLYCHECFSFWLVHTASSAERGQSSGSRAGREGPRTGSEELGPKDQEYIPGEHPASRGTLHAPEGLGGNEKGTYVRTLEVVWLVVDWCGG